MACLSNKNKNKKIQTNMNQTNQLILGDCLDVLKTLPSNSVDLCYIDPPFFSNRNYEVVWGDDGEIRSFEDRWSGGMDHYIGWLKERVIEIHRVLKPTGSFYLHCDWHADAYIRVYILDKVFGEKNFRNEIIWHYQPGTKPSKDFGRKHDNILRYTKSKKYSFNQQKQKSLAEHKYNKVDSHGRSFHINGQGNVYFLDEGRPCDDLWSWGIEKEYNQINSMAKERLGYPTQKPEALLERIIKASSNEGDVVLDCFMGGGTTIAVADKLKRKWIGIDQSVQAVKVSEMRLQKQQDLFSEPFTVQLHKHDYDKLRYSDAFEFEKWIVEKLGGFGNEKQRGDFGIDGTLNNVPIQVKRSDNIGRGVVDHFLSAIKRHDKNIFDKQIAKSLEVGTIIAFSFGKGAIQEVARLKNVEGIVIKLLRVDEIVDIATKPIANIKTTTLGKTKSGWEVEVEATFENKDNIAFCAWEFEHNINGELDIQNKIVIHPEIIRDITFKQKREFKPGYHTIKVVAVDKVGLESSVQWIRFKSNGEVKILENTEKIEKIK
jgi:DNA modification methylase